MIRRILPLLGRHHRRAGLVVILLTLIGTLAETASISLVIPAMEALTNTGGQWPDAAWARALRVLGAKTPNQLAAAAMLALVAIFVLKTAYLAFLIWWQTRYSLRLQVDLSGRLFNSYLHQPWTFHLQRNSAELIRNVITEVSVFAGVVQGCLLLLTEGLAVIGIWILLVLVEPVGAFAVAAVFGAAGWVFHRLSTRPVLRWGEQRQVHDALRLQYLQQGLGGSKEIKLLGREREFFARYAVHNEGTARVSERQITVSNLPRLWLELLGIMGLAVVVLVTLWRGQSLDVIVPTLGVFAAAAFRLMPSINRLLMAMQTIRYGMPVLAVLNRELKLPIEQAAKTAITPLILRSALRIEHVSFAYPDSPSEALCGVDLTIARGTSVGIIGGSGAGKSTLADVLLGLLAPSDGRITVDGVDVQTNLRGWQQQIGYVPQSIYLTDDSLRRNVAFGLADDEIDDERVWQAIRAAQLEVFVGDLRDGLETLVGERGVRLSGGQRQRVGIARALYHEPPVLVLDEATSSLDVETEREFMRAIDALHGQKTIVIIAHRLSTVVGCDTLVRLEAGTIVSQGTAQEVLSPSTGVSGG